MSAPGPSERRACRFRRASAAAGFVIFSALGAFAATLLPPLSGAEVHGSNPLVVELKLDGEVEPILAAYIDEGLADAARRHASLVLITMDTPGGLSDSMKDIIQHILAPPVPVAVYVSPTGSRGLTALKSRWRCKARCSSLSSYPRGNGSSRALSSRMFSLSC